ncbi:hypothetical protein IQ243_28295 [Nostocales cyanobacterium LEGE 11386]|nr:hypothetical protein [Nostocales cyanobacterium LEGE 11386]
MSRFQYCDRLAEIPNQHSYQRVVLHGMTPQPEISSKKKRGSDRSQQLSAKTSQYNP